MAALPIASVACCSGWAALTTGSTSLGAARTLPGFLIEPNPAALRQAFIGGEAAYYVGDSDHLGGLVAAMGEDAVGVALLPTGPNGGAPRPFLNLGTCWPLPGFQQPVFYRAPDLAQYLTDVQNQLNLTTADMGLAPVNNRVRLTPNLPENSLTVARQNELLLVIAFSNRPIWELFAKRSLGVL